MAITRLLGVLALTLAAVATGGPGSARAETISVSGHTTGAPTFQRPVEDLSALSTIGTAAHYADYSFSAAATGLYTFTTTGDFDTFVLLYDAPFMPTAGLRHALIANDDLAAMPFNVSGFQFALVAGRAYSYVVTGFDNDEFGAFQTTIDAPVVASVPEPQSWLLMVGGLAAFGAVRARRARPAGARP